MAEAPTVAPAKGTQPVAAAPAPAPAPAPVVDPNAPIRHINITTRPSSINVTRPERVSAIVYPEGYKPMPADGVTEIFLTPKQARSYVSMKILRAETAEQGEKRRRAGLRAVASAKAGAMGGPAAPLYPPNSPEAREAREAEEAAAADRAARQG